ncbi:uncharacterized protein [Bemisia tabaci]|uniref:uncharacterized protein isoform X9 n=1 Tax=Bemisia tabaci TaxID=7038 RepID=UPI003B28DBA9
MSNSVCNSPARSIGKGDSYSESENESESVDLITEVPGSPDQTIVDGWLKFRDHKKWKQRWGVVTKLSPAAGKCAALRIFPR